jgi:hypothetical protein
VLRCLFEESFVYCCVSFYVALADVVLSTRIMIFSYCCVTLSFFVSMVLIRIKGQVGEKRSTACTHKYTDCLLKNMSTKTRACWWYILLILICVSDLTLFNLLFQWCCLKWRTDSENIGCQETMGAHLHLQCYHLIFIMNKYNFQKKWKAKGATLIFPTIICLLINITIFIDKSIPVKHHACAVWNRLHLQWLHDLV